MMMRLLQPDTGKMPESYRNVIVVNPFSLLLPLMADC